MKKMPKALLLAGLTGLALAAGVARAEDTPARRGPGRTRRARARLHARVEARPLQRVRIPRHFADFREARRAVEHRLHAQERLLPRHVPVEHQMAEGHRRGERLQHQCRRRVGHLRRIPLRVREGLDRRRGVPALRVPELERLQSQAQHRRGVHRRLRRVPGPRSTRTRSTTRSACPTARAATTSRSI